MKKIVVISVLAFSIGVISEYVLLRWANSSYSEPPCTFTEVRKSHNSHLIRPLLMVDTNPNTPDNADVMPLKKILEEEINRDIKANRITAAGIYFRDFSDGHWFSVGSEVMFEPASLIKVPIMMAVLEVAEEKPELLKRKIRFKVPKDLNAVQRVKPPDLMERGNLYSVDELIYRMIAYSDNNATYLLEEVVDPKERDEVFRDLNVNNPYENPNQELYVSAEQYASFFRTLYDASYLSEDLSEKALEYLSRSSFRNGLVAGVPQNITVAHKFGERTDQNDRKTHYLSDCGIVYYPSHPYLLCVMTKGADFGSLTDTIQKISRLAYITVDNRIQIKER